MDNAGGKDGAQSPSGLVTGTWYHVVATYDGTSIRLYLDGTLVSTVGSTRSIPAHASPLRFGLSSAYTNADRYSGSLDEVAVYTTALSAQQVTSHYQAGRR